MNCCGKKRNQMRQEFHPPVVSDHILQGLPANYISNIPLPVRLRYKGNNALTIKGAVSKKQYRFSIVHPEFEVDGVDVSSMLAHPMLEKV